MTSDQKLVVKGERKKGIFDRNPSFSLNIEAPLPDTTEVKTIFHKFLSSWEVELKNLGLKLEAPLRNSQLIQNLRGKQIQVGKPEELLSISGFVLSERTDSENADENSEDSETNPEEEKVKFTLKLKTSFERINRRSGIFYNLYSELEPSNLFSEDVSIREILEAETVELEEARLHLYAYKTSWLSSSTGIVPKLIKELDWKLKALSPLKIRIIDSSQRKKALPWKEHRLVEAIEACLSNYFHKKSISDECSKQLDLA